MRRTCQLAPISDRVCQVPFNQPLEALIKPLTRAVRWLACTAPLNFQNLLHQRRSLHPPVLKLVAGCRSDYLTVRL